MAVIAITGGTGVVGRAVVRQLALDFPDHTLVLLTRHPEQPRFPGVLVAFAEIRQPGLQLAPEVRRLLELRAELFVHAAADTRFNQPLNQSRRTKAEGTQNVIAVARQCPRLRHFAHVSTLFVAGRHQGRIFEQPIRHAAGYVNSYEEAKHEAEDLVLAESANLPAAIYRLNSVVDLAGDGGHVRKVLRLAHWAGRFRSFPGDTRVPVDMISSDDAARALSALLKKSEPGCIRHLCVGERRSISLGRIMDRILAAWESITGRARIEVELVSSAEFERRRRLLTSGGALARAFDSLMTFIPHLCLMQPFDNRVTSSLLRRSGIHMADADSVVTALIEQEFGARASAFAAQGARNT